MECSCCGGPCYVLGVLGSRAHFRWRERKAQEARDVTFRRNHLEKPR
jgi:hypothetical protein